MDRQAVFGLVIALGLAGCAETVFVEVPVKCQLDREFVERPALPRSDEPGAAAHADLDNRRIAWGVEGWSKLGRVVELCAEVEAEDARPEG